MNMAADGCLHIAALDNVNHLATIRQAFVQREMIYENHRLHRWGGSHHRIQPNDLFARHIGRSHTQHRSRTDTDKAHSRHVVYEMLVATNLAEKRTTIFAPIDIVIAGNK